MPPDARRAANRDIVARTPDGERVYAIGDIHGRADLLAKVQAKIDAHRDANPIANAYEIYLGDLIDRGPQSREVIDLLIARAKSIPTIVLAGNHEEIFLRALSEPAVFADWLTYGGRETLLSYGVSLPTAPGEAAHLRVMREMGEKIPPEHIAFIGALPLMHVCGDYLFVHAGLRPNTPLAEQRREDLLWIRRDFLSFKGRFPRKVVHGHTPAAAPEVLRNRVNIDTGAYVTGKLTCLVAEAQRIFFL